MASLHGIHSVAVSLHARLRDAYPTEWRDALPCVFHLVSSGKLEDPGGGSNALVLWLYRVTWNAQLRPTGRGERGGGPLALDLHFLLGVWTESAELEHTLLCWAMDQLHRQPTLDSATLSEEGGWTHSDVLQVVPEELSLEDHTRVWDAAGARYRLCATYVVRGLLIEPGVTTPAAPVLTAKLVTGGQT